MNRQLNVIADVDEITRHFLPESNANELAYQLLNAYLLFEADCSSLHWHGSIFSILTALENSASTLKKVSQGLEVIFSLPKKMKEGCLYLTFNQKAVGMTYAVKWKKECYKGEITDEAYSPLTEKLRRTGFLSLKEVNFLLQKEIIEKVGFPEDILAVDTLCRQIFQVFANSSPEEKIKAVTYLKHKLLPFKSFHITELANSYQWPTSHHILPDTVFQLALDEVENIIECYQEYCECDEVMEKVRKQEIFEHSILPQKKEKLATPLPLTHRRVIDLGICHDVVDLSKRIIRYSSHRDPNVVEAARMLFVGYSLYTTDTLPAQHSGISYLLMCVDPQNVRRHIKRLFKRALTIDFSPPTEKKEGVFHLWLDEVTYEICYEIMKKTRGYQGVIGDPVYDHFKQKLQKHGRLAVKEVNFLVERVIIPRGQMKKVAEVIDPLCTQSLMNFLSLESSVQESAAQMVAMLLEPWSEADFRDGQSHGFYEMAPASIERKEIEEKIVELQHFKKYFRSRQLMSHDAEYFFDADLYQSRIERKEKING